MDAVADGPDSEDELRHAAIAKYLESGAPTLHPDEILVLDHVSVAEKLPRGWTPFDAVDGAGSRYTVTGKNGALKLARIEE